jgi:anthranilate phosphoribosyltransferase
MGVRTLFNVLGPLVNPAAAPNQLIGVFAKDWLVPLAEVLKQLGSQHVLVVHADDGLDELSIACASSVAELKNGQVSTYTVSPEQFGLQRASLDSLAVADAAASLVMVKAVLDGRLGPARDIVLLNAGAALYAANVATDLGAGITLARQAIDSGAARAKMTALVEFSQRF